MNLLPSRGVREAMSPARARSILAAREYGWLLATSLVVAGCLPVARGRTVAPHVASRVELPSARAAPAAKQPSLPPSAPAPGPGERVLEVAERMVTRGTVVRGSCYDYVSAVFAEAGYPSGRRDQVFRGSTSGPYADLS